MSNMVASAQQILGHALMVAVYFGAPITLTWIGTLETHEDPFWAFVCIGMPLYVIANLISAGVIK
jgi:hypothetical protein